MGSRATAMVMFLGLAVAACAPLPQRADIPTQWYPSPNFGERRPNFVILHHTSSGSSERALRALTDPARQVSAHYLVTRAGHIYQLVDERARAWHAGDSFWGGNRDLNSASIGIELDNNGAEPYAEAQIAALLALLADVKQRNAIPGANFLGHGDVAPRRKTDPSHFFPWGRLAAAGFGLWCEPPFTAPPLGMDDSTALRALGYDVSDPPATIAAFRRHFSPEAGNGGPLPALTDKERGLLACLLQGAVR